MDNLQDLLARRMPEEPPEIRAVKAYVRETFDEPASVKATEREVVITVGSAGLASALRARTVEILEACQISGKRLVFRIGRV